MKELPQYILGGLISIGFFLAIYLTIVIVIPEQNQNVVMVLLGALSAKFGDVVAYYYGSSKSSADKTALLADKKESGQ